MWLEDQTPYVSREKDNYGVDTRLQAGLKGKAGYVSPSLNIAERTGEATFVRKNEPLSVEDID